MIITVSGPPGSGKSTLSKTIADHFGLILISSGDVFRAMAEERGVSLEEFGKIAETDPDIDKEIDRRQMELSKQVGDFLFEGRLSGWFIEADLKIMLKTDVEVRARRISQREDISLDQAMDETMIRQQSEAKRYKNYYNIDIADLTPYDLVMESSVWHPEATVKIAITAIDSMKEKRKRG
ncbi:MAG TPA: AAA family ATPase [Candidatus Nanoarchaeia archaeon]|nr:AAA family ATPase [Candidatus Nanoarchaeia archaeon]